MKTDKNGCSTCKAGEEQYEKFNYKSGNKKTRLTQFAYDYRTPQGELFTCIGATLEICREKRDKWLASKLQRIGDE